MARKLNLYVPDIGAPDGTRPDGYFLDEDVGVPGSPILADGKNDIYYFFSKMMGEIGIAFNDLVDNDSVNQFYEALEKVSNIPLEVTTSITETVTIDKRRHYRFILDTTLGAITTTLPDGIFDGQRVNLHCIDAGTANAFYKGTGIYLGASSTGTPLSPEFDIWLEWNDTESRWTYEDVVTADWVSGSETINTWSNGRIKTLRTGILISAAGTALPHSTPFVNTNYFVLSSWTETGTLLTKMTRIVSKLTTALTFDSINTSSQALQNGTFDIVLEGDF